MDATYPGAVAPERHRTLLSFGLRLHVAEWGDPRAPAVVLLHGFYDHVHAFDLMAPLLAESGLRVVAYDARGHGDSEWPDAYAWHTDVLDTVHVLRDLAGPVFLVGHSRGGGLASDAAAFYPEGVRKLVVLDGFGPPPEGFGTAVFKRHQGTPPELLAKFLDWRRGVASRASFQPAASYEDLAARRRAQNPRLSLEWLRYFAAHGSRRVRGGLVWNFDPLAARGTGPFRPDWIAPGWRRLRMPMLAVIGSEPDSWGPLPEQILAPRLANVPQLTRATVQDAGHFMHIEQPQATARLILDFLEHA